MWFACVASTPLSLSLDQENRGVSSVDWESDRILFGEWVGEEQSQRQGQSGTWAWGTEEDFTKMTLR